MTIEARSSGLFTLVLQLFRTLSKRRKWQLLLLIIMMLISSFTEVISIGAVLPFIAMLTAPEKLYHHPLLNTFNQYFHITSAGELIFPITLFFVLIVLFTGIFRVVMVWVTSRITAACGSQISSDVFKRILYQPYVNYLAQNTSETINTMTHKVDTVVFGIIFPFLTLINSMILLIAILTSLILIQPFVAVTALLIFGFTYFIIAWFVRKAVRKNGQFIVANQTKKIKVIQESLGGIRDMILDGSQEVFSKIYEEADMPTRKSNALNNFISQSPRIAMESIGIIVLSLLAFYMARQSGNIQKVLPILGTIGLGSQRILPSIQQVYTSWVSITSSYNQLADILLILRTPLRKSLNDQQSIHFSEKIVLTNISFRYSETSATILKNINLTIHKGTQIGIIGTTGTGKSTLIDILMGLLPPSDGQILVDGKILSTDTNRSWQRNIAHVPQSIFLADTSIAENIAFGVEPSSINRDRLLFAARIACVSEFAESYPEGYNTIVGERGINLSGGQRQRIGIARALYKNASVLIFDEATSALDNDTERKIMKGLSTLDKNLTLFIIAHRLSTLIDCDIIFEIKNGTIVERDKMQVISAIN